MKLFFEWAGQPRVTVLAYYGQVGIFCTFENITHVFNKILLIVIMLDSLIRELLQFMCHKLIHSHKMSKLPKHALKGATP